jgi:hypothetical protein
MNADKPTPDNGTRGTWYVAPLVWLAIAVISMVVTPNWNDLLAEPARGSGPDLRAPQRDAAVDTSVPAASSVFNKPHYPAEEHAQGF